MKKIYNLTVYTKDKIFLKSIKFDYIAMHNINNYINKLLDHNDVYNNII
jgi:hypothetical protein